MPNQFTLPRQVKINVAGRPYAGAQAFFYQTDTETPQQVFQDNGLTIPHAQPVIADDDGYFPVIWLDNAATADYRVRIQSSTGSLLDDLNNVRAAPVSTSDVLNVLDSDDVAGKLNFFSRTAAEQAANLTLYDTSRTPTPIDVMRHGIVPNNASLRAQNTARIKALLKSDIVGPVGRLIFPPITGADTYYFDGFFPSRDGVVFDGMNCTIDLAKSYSAADDQNALFYFVRNSGVENATINFSYNGSAGTHAGNVIRVGNRDSSGDYFHFGDENVLGTPIGRVTLKNLRITTNNPVNDGAILMFGGLRDVIVENVVINGSNACSYGILYEFGTYDSTTTPDVTSHASNLVFRNVRVSNLATTFGEGAGIALGGAYNAIIENLHVNVGYNALSVRTGESLFYTVPPYDTNGAKRCITLRNIVGDGITNNGIQLIGAESAAGGFLSTIITSPYNATELAAQTDLGMFSLDGFALSCGGVGISVSGACDIRNGVTLGCTSGILIDDTCPRFGITNVEIRDSTSIGIRGNFGGGVPSVLAPNRKKAGYIRNCKIVGGDSTGISLDMCEGVTIENNQIGYHTNYDPVSETSQLAGIALDANAFGVTCRGNFISTSGGALAYTNASTSDHGHEIWNARGTFTYTAGVFKIDGVVESNDTDIASKTSPLNTVGKYSGKEVWDTSNNRKLRALGSGDTSGWRIVDGSATVTPA